jgi:serine/threonine protein kinase
MQVAVKIYEKIKLSEASRKKSYLREVQILTKLNHPQIPTLFDVIESYS